MTVPLEASFCQYVQATGAPVVVADAARDARVANTAMRLELNIGAYAGVPIRLSDGSLYGALCGVDPLPHTFNQLQIDLLQIVAGQLALAIEFEQSVSTNRQAEYQLDVMRRTLDEQTTLLRVVAHDIRSPLSSISGFIDLLQQDALGPISAAQQSALERIKQASRLIARLTTDLTDTLAIETQTLTLQTQEFDPGVIALLVLESCRPLATARGLAIEFRGAGNLPCAVGDPDRVQQVLFNLLTNAVRYTTAGGVVLSIAAQQEMVEFRVEDTGPGISDQDQEQIWKPYIRATTQGKGLGLGLYVVQRLVHAMGGNVGMHSVVGQGSAFWISLPSQPRVQAVGRSVNGDTGEG
jgi:signal transduction histidine kinase